MTRAHKFVHAVADDGVTVYCEHCGMVAVGRRPTRASTRLAGCPLAAENPSPRPSPAGGERANEGGERKPCPPDPLRDSFTGKCFHCNQYMDDGMIVEGRWTCPACQDKNNSGQYAYYSGSICADCGVHRPVRQVRNGPGPLCETCFEKEKVRHDQA